MTILKYVLFDILQNKIVLAYTLFLMLVSWGLFGLSNDPAKGLVSLLNIVLIVTPLVALIFSTIHLYNASEFIELMAAQPIRRSIILWSEFGGLTAALSLAVLLGLGVPVMVYAGGPLGLSLILAALALTWCFVALACLTAVATRDKARGIGMALMLWFYFALLYDALLLLVLFAFGDYPMEKVALLLTALNPIDLARVLVLLQMDISALMGYTGAVFSRFFGSALGVTCAGLALLLWVAVPFWWSYRIFLKKDL
ncbi:MAG: ABC transporter permease subunit [Saprospiraceae bacterium]|nr:ABC transporter permease subunit [Saprospiraceae bacterium]